MGIKTIVINLDNGPENSMGRTQWIKRMLELSARFGLTIVLAYYPPYHSKYNPVERVFGCLENHWRGSIIDSVDKALGYASTTMYRGQLLNVELAGGEYPSGVKVPERTMKIYRKALGGKEGIEDWFAVIDPDAAREALAEAGEREAERERKKQARQAAKSTNAAA
jgi:hypothetical protein